MREPYFYVDEELGPVGRRDSFWRTYFEGRELGVPRCCALRYSWGEYRDPEHDQAVERGVSVSPLGWEYVPCGLLHRATYTYEQYGQHLNALEELAR